jgi:hypothetical protein
MRKPRSSKHFTKEEIQESDRELRRLLDDFHDRLEALKKVMRKNGYKV